ncbi:MAG: response regulator [Dermatophilaceae bacterium]
MSGAETAAGMPAGLIRVVIVDDHDLYRQGMAVVVGLDGTATVVGTAANGAEAVEVCAALRPDVCLMDVRMPVVGGIDGCRRVRAEAPGTRILMLTMSDDETDLFEAVKAGASGYLLKDMPGEEVSEAIRRVHDGHAIVPPGMASTVLRELGVLGNDAVAAGGTETRLTDCEVQVLRLVARGMVNRDIAAELVVAEDTVKEHVRGILEKLHLHSRAATAVTAHHHRPLGWDG